MSDSPGVAPVGADRASGPGRGLRGPLLVGVGAAALLGALRLHDPHSPGSWGVCPFLALTGQPCPGCGGLRAVNDLTHGDVAAALSSNAAAVVLVLVVGVAWVRVVALRTSGRAVAAWPTWPWWPVAVGAVFVAFGAFRLTPWGAGLRP